VIEIETVARIARIACIARVKDELFERMALGCSSANCLEESECFDVPAEFADGNSKHALASAADANGAQISAADFLADEGGAHADHFRDL
jgi:hypothetical protein